MTGFSVIMPTYNQDSFILRAIRSLFQQTYTQWELIIINDGSTDNTDQYISELLIEYGHQITYIKNEQNMGIGYCINKAIALASYYYIAYLPSDDYFYKNHLATLFESLEQSQDIVLAFSGMKYASNDSLNSTPDVETKTTRNNYCLQLVQVAHRKTEDLWIERSEWVSENLYYTFWQALTTKGAFYPTQKITSHWSSHPHQRHKIMAEKYGGNLNYYRNYYKVKTPLKIKVSDYKFVDESVIYENFIDKPVLKKQESLKILIVGELGYNPERIASFETAGHQLYGLWIERPPYPHINIGPIPFGNVEYIDYANYKNEIRRIKPDVIYGLLNFCAVDLAYDVMQNFPEIPFAWHFKESPQVCMAQGNWKKLMYLYTNAHGKIYINEECKKWFEQFMSVGTINYSQSFILDGDLPHKDFFSEQFSPKLSSLRDGVHTVVVGRMIGMNPNDLKFLSEHNIHIHLYTESYHERHQDFIRNLKKMLPNHFHIHKHCKNSEWVTELSQYDAGWLHCFDSANNGELDLVGWDDLNIPARLSVLAAAGLPVIQKDNRNHIVAMQSIVKKYAFGIFYNTPSDLAKQLTNSTHLKQLTENIKTKREHFTFDFHLPALVEFFGTIIDSQENEK